MMLAQEMSWLLCKTNRFHISVGLYSDNAQRTSKCGTNISQIPLSSPGLTFIICALSEYSECQSNVLLLFRDDNEG